MSDLYIFKGSFCRGLGVVKQFEGVVSGARCQNLFGGMEGKAGDFIDVVVQRPNHRVILHVLLRRLIHHHLTYVEMKKMSVHWLKNIRHACAV